MKDNSFLPATFRFANEAAVRILQESAHRPFSVQVSLLSLDPRHDLVNSDLEGVDFSCSDLRGYDFSGADLRGCVGLGVRWDNSTILAGARLAGSIFAAEYRIADLLSKNPSASKTLEALGRASDTEQIVWTANSLATPRRDLDQATAIAIGHALFRQGGNAYLQSQLLFFLSPRMGHDEVKEMLLDVLSTRSGSGALVQSAFDVVRRRRLVSDADIRRMIIALLKSENPLVRERAANMLLRTGSNPEEQALIAVAARTDPVVGNVYVSEVSAKLSEAHALVARDPITNVPFGIDEMVPSSTVDLIAKRWVRAVSSRGEEKEGVPLMSRKGDRDQFVSETVIAERSVRILALWEDLRAKGINLSLTSAVPIHS